MCYSMAEIEEQELREAKRACNFIWAAALSLLLFFVTTGGEKNLIQEIGKTNWAPVVMGLFVLPGHFKYQGSVL